jgi:hypothetical protein
MVQRGTVFRNATHINLSYDRGTTPGRGKDATSSLHHHIRDSSVGIAFGYGLDDRGSRVRFPAGLEIFVFITASSRTALGPTQPSIQWVAGALSLGVKRPGREADHSPPSSADVKECVELYLHPNTSWRGAQLKHRDNFTFNLQYSPPHLCHLEKTSVVRSAFYLYHRIQSASGAHPFSLSIGYRGLFTRR